MGKESLEKPKIKEGKMEELKKPEWLKEVEEKLTKDNGLYQGLEKISELPNAEQLVTREEIEELNKEALQKGLEAELTEGYIDSAKKVEEYAKEKGIELEFKEETLQKGFEAQLARDWIDDTEEIQEYAKEKGIELNLKKGLQKGFEYSLSFARIDFAKKVEEYAKEKGIELTFSKRVKDIVEESYIRTTHNPQAGHAEHKKRKLLGAAKEKGIELNYNEVVKMDYLDFLNVPKKDRLEQEKEVKIGDADLESKFYGQIKENECKGKFILAQDLETKEVKFIFDATLGEHKDIAAKYDVDVIGGGWLEIDKENRKITISEKSQDFGYEPRIISAAIILENFPNYEVSVEE